MKPSKAKVAYAKRRIRYAMRRQGVKVNTFKRKDVNYAAGYLASHSTWQDMRKRIPQL